MATLKNDLSLHNLTSEDAIELALYKRCGDYWQQAELRTDGACRIMMIITINIGLYIALDCSFRRRGMNAGQINV